MNNWLNIFFVGWATIIWWLVNYFYHPLMLRYLTIQEYGTFATLVSLFNILGVLTAWISFFLNREISKNVNDLNYVKSIFVNWLKVFFLVWIISYLIYLIFIPFLKISLKIQDTSLFLIVWLTLILSFVWVNISASLMWLKKFKLLSILSIINPFIKLWLGFLFLLLWYKVFWAIFAFALSSFIWLLFAFYLIVKSLKNYKVNFNSRFLLKDFWKQKKDIFSYVVLLALTAFFMNIDILLARNIFNETVSGYYAWISMMWKFMIFALASIETVYYPQVMEISQDLIDWKIDKKYLIINPIKMYFVLWIIGIIVNLFLWKMILWILKPWLVEYFNSYLLLLIFFLWFALFSFLSKILIGLNKYKINWVIWFFLILLFVLVKIFWNISLNMYIAIYIWIIFVLDLILWIVLFRFLKRK